MLKTSYGVTDHRIKAKSSRLKNHRERLEGVVERLRGLDGVIESWTRELGASIQECQDTRDSNAKIANEVEETKVNQETTEEQKIALSHQVTITKNTSQRLDFCPLYCMYLIQHLVTRSSIVP